MVSIASALGAAVGGLGAGGKCFGGLALDFFCNPASL
jgi:hypothetical protein